MLSEYRDWLVSELKLLANASHHAYAFGQVNMAQRAIERLDAELAAGPVLELDRTAAERALAALDTLAGRPGDPADELAALRAALRTALGL